MMDLVELASTLFGSRRAESDSIPPDATVQMISASGAVDSVDGSAGVVMDCEITPADDTEGDESVLDIPTSPSVKTDDDLLVGLVGSGPLKTPVVLANPGFGDRIQVQMDVTEELVERAERAAAATSQHFWHDDSGAHVTQVTQDEWTDQTGASYHSGPNSLWNSLGMLFRDGLTNLLAVLTNGVAIYDGNGNAASNILAEFTANLVRIGGRFASSGESSAGVQFFNDDSSTSDLTARHYIDTQQDMQVYHDLMLSSTTTDELLTGSEAEHYASGNADVYQEVYNDGTNWSEESNAALNAKVSNADYNAAIGVNVLTNSTGGLRRMAYAIADRLRLTYGTGSGATVSTFEMSAVADALGGTFPELSVVDGLTVDGTRYAADYVRDMLSSSHVSLTMGTAASDWNDARAYRSGKVINVFVVNVKLKSTLATNTTSGSIATIPVGYRPAFLQRVPCAIGTSGNYGNVWAAIGSGGSIAIRNASTTSLSTSLQITLSCTYVVS